MEDYSGLIFLALPLVLLVFLMSQGRRRQRALIEAQAAARPGAWAMTTSGLHGQVVSAEDGEPTVLLEIAPGVHTRWARQAIAEVYDDDPVTRHARASTVDVSRGSSAASGPRPDDRDGTPDGTTLT